MKTSLTVAAVLAGLVIASPARAEPPPVRGAVRTGLDWLARQQTREGTWAGNGGTFPTAVTALAGTALLMEGSTLHDGAYSEHLRRAVAWYRRSAQENGLLVPANSPTDQGRYMLGHGFAMLFLSGVYSREEPGETRDALRRLLDRAVDFAASAQSKTGGWGYVAAADGGDFDEGNATVTVLQGLLAARRAGIKVSRDVLDKAQKYHAAATTRQGGVVYSVAAGAGGDGRPIITAGAAACALLKGDRPDEQLKRWTRFLALNYHQDVVSANQRRPFDSLQHFYLARVVYGLGDGGHQKLDPAAKEVLPLWPTYRNVFFPLMQHTQEKNGNWDGGQIGPTFETALRLIVLQLDSNDLAVFAR
jgi:hypothetical protein